MRLPIAAVAAVLALTACAGDTRDVELSYRVTPEGCEGCDGYELTFRSGGHVWLTGVAGCMVPGTHHYRIPSSDFDALVQGFHRARFFSIPRKGPMAFDTGLVVVSYRDNARIHEVEDRVWTDPRLRTLERQLGETGRPERYLTPSPDLYKELLGSRWDINSKNRDGWTALRCAISRNRVDAVRLLLDNKASVSTEDLRVAAWLDSAALPLLVPAAHLDPYSQNAADLLVTLASTRGTMLSLALDYGIPVDAIAANGKTALVAAIEAASNQYSVAALNAAMNAAARTNVALLLAHGANPNLKLKKDETPLHHAAVSAETALIGLLLRSGARIDSRDANEQTPLMHAARRCSYWNIRALRDAGADVRAATPDGRSALDLAAPKRDIVVGGEFAYNRKNCELTRQALGAAN